MTKVEFYFHVRADGGRRCGLNINGFTALEAYVPSDDEDAYDPVVRWKLHEADLTASIRNAAEQLMIGLDEDSLDWNFPFTVDRGGVSQVYDVVVGGQRRYIGRDFGGLLESFLADWQLFLPNMQSFVLGAR